MRRRTVVKTFRGETPSEAAVKLAWYIDHDSECCLRRPSVVSSSVVCESTATPTSYSTVDHPLFALIAVIEMDC